MRLRLFPIIVWAGVFVASAARDTVSAQPSRPDASAIPQPPVLSTDTMPSVSLSAAVRAAYQVAPRAVAAGGLIGTTAWQQRNAVLSLTTPSLSVGGDLYSQTPKVFNFNVIPPTGFNPAAIIPTSADHRREHHGRIHVFVRGTEPLPRPRGALCGGERRGQPGRRAGRYARLRRDGLLHGDGRSGAAPRRRRAGPDRH